jgi:hypothetical protein
MRQIEKPHNTKVLSLGPLHFVFYRDPCPEKFFSPQDLRSGYINLTIMSSSFYPQSLFFVCMSLAKNNKISYRVGWQASSPCPSPVARLSPEPDPCSLFL